MNEIRKAVMQAARLTAIKLKFGQFRVNCGPIQTVSGDLG